MKRHSVLIVGGGTGGHISPGLALYEKFIEMGQDTFVLVGQRDKRFPYLNLVRKDQLLTYKAPPFTKNIFKLPFFVIRFLLADRKIRRFIRKNDIEAVIGMGGYVSAPALMAAKKKKIPIYLCEQNSVPGKVTLFFAKNAQKIFITFDNCRSYFKPEQQQKLELSGNPVRKGVLLDMDKKSAREAFNLKDCRKVLLVIGGSQGSLRLNELVFNLKKEYTQDFRDIGIIWAAGSATYQRFKDELAKANFQGPVYLSQFIENVGQAYRASDLAISRAGSGVMVELAAAGIPSVLIPYPFAADDHQNKNADVFVQSGASIKIDDRDAATPTQGELIMDLINDDKRLSRMSESAIKAARIESAADICNAVLKGLV